jgi:hypothetical protein
MIETTLEYGSFAEEEEYTFIYETDGTPRHNVRHPEP